MSIALAGAFLVLIGWSMLVFSAFRVSMLWGLSCLFLPILMIPFVGREWSRAKHGFGILLLGFALFAIGYLVQKTAA